MAPQLRRSQAIASCGVAVVIASGWLVGHRRDGPDSRLVTGVVAIVNAFQSKVCVTEDGATEQWRGPVAVSGEEIAAGQRVTMIITPLRTTNGSTLELGTVVPSGLGAAR